MGLGAPHHCFPSARAHRDERTAPAPQPRLQDTGIEVRCSWTNTEPSSLKKKTTTNHLDFNKYKNRHRNSNCTKAYKVGHSCLHCRHHHKELSVMFTPSEWVQQHRAQHGHGFYWGCGC